MKNFLLKVLVLMALGVVGFEAQGQYNPWTETGAPVGREIGSGRMIYVPQGGYPIGLFLPVAPRGYIPSRALVNGRYSRSVLLAQVPAYQPVQLSDGRTVWEGDENGTTRYYSHDPRAEAQATLTEARAEQVRADTDAQYAQNERYRARTISKSDRWTDQRLQSGSHQRANNEVGRQIEEGRPSAVAARHLGYQPSQTRFQPTALGPDRFDQPVVPAVAQPGSSADSVGMSASTATVSVKPLTDAWWNAITTLQRTDSSDSSAVVLARQQVVARAEDWYHFIEANPPADPNGKVYLGMVAENTVQELNGLGLDNEGWFLSAFNGAITETGRP